MGLPARHWGTGALEGVARGRNNGVWERAQGWGACLAYAPAPCTTHTVPEHRKSVTLQLGTTRVLECTEPSWPGTAGSDP